ncbi:MAG: methylenetetrahydrofolate reductase [Chloroflexota bacterium]
MKSGSRLERVLRSGRFAVTAELNPPDSADAEAVYERALVLASVCDDINATDASGANVHMSSVGMCALLTRAGYEPVMQVSCRDRNRIAIQGDLLGAAAMGVRNVLCLTGDGVQAGDQPEAKPVFDLDSISLLRTARLLRDDGRFLSGRQLEARPAFFLGAAANPFVPPYEFRAQHLAKKVEAGADFIQTQFCFDIPRLEQFMAAVPDLGLDRRAFILAGVGPLRSAKAAEWMQRRVPGVVVPDEIVRRLRAVPPERQREEGKRLCVEIIQQVREIPGIHGIHVMAYRQEELVAEIIEAAGLLPRRSRRPPQTKEIEENSEHGDRRHLSQP